MSFRKISVIGLGYIGLPTAVMFASAKKQVVGVDINQSVVETINRGEMHIVEPGLGSLVRDTFQAGFLSAAAVPSESDAFLIAVPTPIIYSDDKKPTPDLSYVEAAVHSVAPVLKKGDLIILESTSPVGTTEKMVQWMKILRSDLTFPIEGAGTFDVNVAYCPERVLPGQVVRELVENDRVIGGMSAHCAERAIDLYRIFVKGECVITNARTAEMVKLTENACRDTQIAFANELSMICDELNIDVGELISLANRHPRIGILQPGPGVGGHCIAVDPWFIISKSPNQTKLLQAARSVNLSKQDWVVNKVKSEVARISSAMRIPVSDVRIAYFGLAFKPNIDDLRESPALSIVNELQQLGAQYVCVEPNISLLESHTLETIDYAIEHSDLIVMLVKHNEFVTRKFELLSAQTMILDFCGMNDYKII